MSTHKLADFPPHWEPPPRYLKGEQRSLTLDVWDEILRKEPSQWVRDLYLLKLKAYVSGHFFHMEFEKLSAVLNRMPDEEALALLKQIHPDSGIRERLDLRPELREKITPKGD
jgi:hypothetical protein